MKLNRYFSKYGLIRPVTLLLLLALAFMLSGAPPVYANSWTVNSAGDTGDTLAGDGFCIASGGGCTLRAAIQEANAYATIPDPGPHQIGFTGPAVYNIALGSPLPTIGNVDSINGAGATVAITAAANQRVFVINGGVTIALSNMTISDNGSVAADGGCIYNSGTLTLNSTTMQFCSVIGSGGGIYSSGSLTLNSSTIQNNVSNGGSGGGIYSSGSLALTSSTIQNNLSTGGGGGGGGVYQLGDLTIDGGSFQNNIAYSNGGAIYVGGSLTTLNNPLFGTVTRNTSNFDAAAGSEHGGAVYVAGNATLGTALSGGGGDFVNNLANCPDNTCHGGGIYVGDTLTAYDFSFSDNHARGSGGGAYVVNEAILSNGSFVHNLSSLNDSYTGPSAGGYGGGLYTGTDLTMTAIDFTNNVSYYDGGGAYTPNSADVTGGSFTNNTCSDACWGGGIHTGDPEVSDSDDELLDMAYHLTITDTTFTDNYAHNDGGGAYAHGPANTLRGSFTNNWGEIGSGGGLFTHRTLTISATQFFTNTAMVRGGGAFSQEQANIQYARFQGNDCTGGGCLGGGLYAFNTLWMDETVFESNTAMAHGGGAYMYLESDVSDTDFYNNRCTESTSRGGGVFARYILNMARVEFVNNTVKERGGGLYMEGEYPGNSSMTNVLFARNRTTNTNPLYSYGDAMYLYPATTTGVGSTMTIRHATISNPSATGTHQAIYIPKGTLVLSNSLISEYTTGLQIAGTASAAENYNIWTNALKVDTSSGSITTGSRVWTNKNLAFVDTTAGAGAPTSTTDNYHLSPPSWGIDRGLELSVTDDLDQADRPTPVTWPDLGAYESLYYIDTAITKTVTVGSGGLLTYTLTFSQAGTGGVATDNIITDVVALNNPQFTYTADVVLTQTAGITYEWTTPELVVGQGGIITITGTSAGGCGNLGVFTATTVSDFEPSGVDNNRALVGTVCYVYLPIITKVYSTTP